MRIQSVQTARHLSWLSNLFTPSGAITYQSSKLNSLPLLALPIFAVTYTLDRIIILHEVWRIKQRHCVASQNFSNTLSSTTEAPSLRVTLKGRNVAMPQISQGSNELHIALRLGTHRPSQALIAALPPAALQAYRISQILGQQSPPGFT